MASHDLKVAVRSLVRRPGFTVTVIVLLALSAGANAAVFSIVRSVLLRPLPYAHPEGLAAFSSTIAPEDLEYLTSRVAGIESISGLNPGWMMALVDDQGPIKITADKVTDNYFAVLGLEAALGRTISKGDGVSGRHRVALLAHRFWRQRYGARAEIVGQFVRIDDEPYEVIGVLPPGSAAAVDAADTDVWIPQPIDSTAANYRQPWLGAIARLARGTTADQIDARLQTLIPEMQSELRRPPDFGRTLRVKALHETVVGPIRSTLGLIFGAVGLVLLMAAVNHGTLMLGRSVERRRELAVRSALGAERWRIVRMVLTEHVLLASVGAAVGVALAYAGLPLLVRYLPPEIPRLEEIRLDAVVVLSIVASVLLLAVFFGTTSMMGGVKLRIAALLRQSQSVNTPAQHRTLSLLVAGQIALAVTLGIGAGLMVRSLWQLQKVNPGFGADRVLTLRLQTTARYRRGAAGVPYVREVLGRLSALPGVTSVGAIQHLPLSGYSWTTTVEVPTDVIDPTAPKPRAGWRFVEGEYFRAMGIPVLTGRVFDTSDHAEGQQVALVNDTFARLRFGGRDAALGRELSMPSALGPGQTRVVIVGVVGDVRHLGLDEPPLAEVFRPLAQVFMMPMAVVIRTDGTPAALAAAAREAVWAVDPAVPVAELQPLDTLLQMNVGRPRLIARLLLIFAVSGLILGIIGVYGVAAYRVRGQERELGVRLAIGAAPGQIGALVLRSALKQTALGLAIGLPAAWGGARLLGGLLFEVSADDPATFVALPAAVVLASVAACAVPAVRAARMDPVVAMRAE